MTKRGAVRAARARGMVRTEVVRQAAPVRHRRTCVTCGQRYIPQDDAGRKPFCCGCCAAPWGVLYDAERRSPPEPGKGFRWMHVGDRVVLCKDGRAGVLRQVPHAGEDGEGIVEIDGELLLVGVKDVERVLGLVIEHSCGKGKNPFARARANKGAIDGEPEDAGDVPSGTSPRGADS